MKRYMVCALLLFSHVFNCSSEQSRSKKFKEHHRLGRVMPANQNSLRANQDSQNNGICCGLMSAGCLVVGGMLVMALIWPTNESIAHHRARHVDCTRPFGMNGKALKNIYDIVCDASPTDGTPCKPYFGKATTLPRCNLTVAQQEAIRKAYWKKLEEKNS